MRNLILLAGALALLPTAVPAQESDAPSPEPPAAAPALTRAPELIEYVDPAYPEDAQAEEVEGEVVLVLTLDAEGRVTEVAVAQGLDPRLDAAAVEAARRLRFRPAELDGVPAAIRLEFRYGFTLEEAEPPPGEAVAEAEAEAEAPPPVTLRGTVRVRGRRDPVPGALVIAGEQADGTDAEGRFELALPPGRHAVEVKAPGFHVFGTSEEIREGQLTEVTYYLQRRGPSPFETVVRADRPKKDVTRLTLRRDELQKVPGTFGDPLRVLENLPGLSRAPLIGGALLVRGASPGDSGVYFDGVQIPLLYHFGGLTSVVNPEFLERIDFRPGGFGVQYGRAIAGVVDVETRRATDGMSRGAVKVDLMDTSLFLQHTFSDELAVAVAGRRSYVDLVLPAFLNALEADEGLTLAPVYGDYQAKVDWDPHPDHHLSLFSFGSSDTFNLLAPGGTRARGIRFDLLLAFHRVMLGHTWRLSDDVELRTRPWAGVTLQGFGGGEVGGDFQFDADLRWREAGWREDLTWRASERLTLRAGLDAYALWAEAWIDAPLGLDLIAFPSPIIETPTAQEAGLDQRGVGLGSYLEATWEPVRGLYVTPGLRYELYVFDAANHPTLDPRLALRWEVDDATTLKAAAGIFHQPPSVFQLNELTGNPDLHPEGARHYVAGVERKLTEVLDLGVELFLAHRYDLGVTSDDGDAVSDGTVQTERYENEGVARAFGAEVLLRHQVTDRFFGWLAYTLMRSEEQDHRGEDFVPTPFDQTHILTLVGSWRPGGGFEVGGRFRLVSGNPYTPVYGAVHDMDTDGWRAIRGPHNSARLPTFHQLDVRVGHTTVFDTWTLTVFLDLINAYNRRNIENFQYDYRYREKIGFALLPIFPVLGVKGEW